jgi:hypothetical protein
VCSLRYRRVVEFTDQFERVFETGDGYTVEMAEAITTCACGHTLAEHDEDGCAVGGCECELERDEAVEAEVRAVDDL